MTTWLPYTFCWTWGNVRVQHEAIVRLSHKKLRLWTLTPVTAWTHLETGDRLAQLVAAGRAPECCEDATFHTTASLGGGG